MSIRFTDLVTLFVGIVLGIAVFGCLRDRFTRMSASAEAAQELELQLALTELQATNEQLRFNLNAVERELAEQLDKAAAGDDGGTGYHEPLASLAPEPGSLSDDELPDPEPLPETEEGDE